MAEYRHRINEIYPESVLKAMDRVRFDPRFSDNNQKIEENLMILKDLDVTFIAAGTNRMSILKDDYIHKIALDSFGAQDNWTEFDRTIELQPYVTKTYECNGLIAVAEYVNLFNKEEFVASREHIAGILEALSENWLFCDMSLTAKNFCNFGYRPDGDIVILDYGYIFPIDRKIMRCRSCGSPLVWNSLFSKLKCSKCGSEHDPIEIRDRMRKKESDFDYSEEEELPDGPLVLEVRR